jgi:hypothetical protein
MIVNLKFVYKKVYHEASLIKVKTIHDKLFVVVLLYKNEVSFPLSEIILEQLTCTKFLHGKLDKVNKFFLHYKQCNVEKAVLKYNKELQEYKFNACNSINNKASSLLPVVKQHKKVRFISNKNNPTNDFLKKLLNKVQNINNKI